MCGNSETDGVQFREGMSKCWRRNAMSYFRRTGSGNRTEELIERGKVGENKRSSESKEKRGKAKICEAESS